MNTEEKIVPYAVSMPPGSSWLVFAPHADDETFGMGGTLLRAKAEGISVKLVVMTDGALGGLQADLVEVRKREVQKAAAMLGIAELIFLGEPDRGLQLSDKLSNKLAELIRHANVQTVFFPGMFEPHPDHRTTALLVWKALGELVDGELADGELAGGKLAERERPAAVAYEISVQNPVNCLVDISEQMATKQQVMNIYCSQLLENNYPEVVQAMHKLRTFSLPSKVKFAEGFYCFAREDLQYSLQFLMEKYLRELF